MPSGSGLVLADLSIHRIPSDVALHKTWLIWLHLANEFKICEVEEGRRGERMGDGSWGGREKGGMVCVGNQGHIGAAPCAALSIHGTGQRGTPGAGGSRGQGCARRAAKLEKVWSTSPVRSGWGSWGCWAWRREGSAAPIALSTTPWKEAAARWEAASSARQPAMEQEEVA